MFDIESVVDTVIKETELYYREQIFSSGCSSLVPIYRISDNTKSSSSLIKQLEGSPYIQKQIAFNERVIATLLDVDLYVYEDKHFFLQGDMHEDVAKFVESCQKISSFDSIVAPETEEKTSASKQVQGALKELATKYPILKSMDLKKILHQIHTFSQQVEFDKTIEGYLQIFEQQDWAHKKALDRTSLICMVSLGNRLGWGDTKIKQLITLGVLKDIGYARLQDHIDNFEVMHPLVSHKIISEVAEGDDIASYLSSDLIDSILVHHEFCDGSGPLARMLHPVVTQKINSGLPLLAQVSGICDLYLGFFEKYTPPIAFAITCGFVLGQGDVPPRYAPEVIQAFITDFKEASYRWGVEESDESIVLVDTILSLLKDPLVQKKASSVVSTKSRSEFDRITLALNVVRNIARKNPEHMGEQSLVEALYLPLEFGLNY